jgi:hypothetical protein
VTVAPPGVILLLFYGFGFIWYRVDRPYGRCIFPNMNIWSGTSQ